MPFLLFLTLFCFGFGQGLWADPPSDTGQDWKEFPRLGWEQIREGDILFQNLDCGPLCEAIETVTRSAGGRDFSHCALVTRRNGEWGVIEAYGTVRFTPMDSFRRRVMAPGRAGAIILGRLKAPLEHLPGLAAQKAEEYLGLPYDGVFLMNNQALYCSELVYDAYKEAGGGEPVFVLEPMEFRDPGTGDWMPTWVDYYDSLGHPIPQGEPGINPGSLSRHPRLELFEMEALP